MYSKIDRCRICGGTDLAPVLDLGEQMLTGVFPASREQQVTSGPLRLVKCRGENACGLLQLEHSYDSSEMYGANYGYRSGLNPSMVAHLQAKVRRILGQVELHDGDLVIDIGSNDGTTLAAYPAHGPVLVGVDPTGAKFREYYPAHVELIPEFFPSPRLAERFPGKKARVITSFSMFYDLDSPEDFMRDVRDALAEDGIWVFEQSYMPTMLEMNAYDTVCHEHVEYYAMRQIDWMARRVGLRIIDVEFNDVNGGSFSVTCARDASPYPTSDAVAQVLADEQRAGLDTLEPYLQFAERTRQSREDILEFIGKARAEGRSVAALGASTKGNVILQYCKLGPGELLGIGEVNQEKFGCVTPGSWIPIIPESELLAQRPDYLLVMPWHFRSFFLNNAKFRDRNLVFPLPRLEVVPARAG